MKIKKWALKSLIFLVVFLLLGTIAILYINWHNNYRGRIYPGIRVGSLDLSGKTAAEATNILNQKTSELVSAGLTFRANNKNITINTDITSFDSDLSYPALYFNVEDTVNKAVTLSSPDNFGYYLLFRLRPRSQRLLIPFYTLDPEKIKTLLADSFPELNIEPTNSSFSVSTKTGDLQTSPEKIGVEINYDLALSEIRTNLANLNNQPITLMTHSKYPLVKESDLGSLTAEAKTIIKEGGLKLTFGENGAATSSLKTWTIKPEKLITWLSVVSNQGNLSLSLDQEKIKQYLSLNVSPEIDVEAVRPRFEIKDGKVSSWQTGVDGRQVDLDASAAKITSDFLGDIKEIPIITKEVTSETIAADNNLNIKEIIGVGHSNFVGSPTNRIKNIQVGAAALNGLLIAPGEEFSLVKVLGDVSAKTGYFPELVIKGDQTVPEYGGGLCQIATTVFRAAMGTGLPITERRNHSYRVSYYEPAGMDAAVYLPQPDVRFVNDTANYILIQSRIVKNDIYFDFWGTSDGRVATTTTPVVYNIVKPPATKYIETTSLAPGVKKCTEHAHNGADAYFDYSVIYPASTTGATSTPNIERRFSSHYVPWQEVCLIGKEAVATSTPPINASSTPADTSSTTPSN
ncbi:MAG: VanW family protein [Patescibacteria group bacterium]